MPVTVSEEHLLVWKSRANMRLKACGSEAQWTWPGDERRRPLVAPDVHQIIKDTLVYCWDAFVAFTMFGPETIC